MNLSEYTFDGDNILYKKGKALSKHWHSSDYRRYFIQGKYRYVHRVHWEISFGPIPLGYEIDHINGIRSDNRLQNLRLVTHSTNQRSRAKVSGKTSRYKGVTWSKSRNKWEAKTCFEGKTKLIGRFHNELEAAKAYDAFVFIIDPAARVNGV